MFETTFLPLTYDLLMSKSRRPSHHLSQQHNPLELSPLLIADPLYDFMLGEHSLRMTQCSLALASTARSLLSANQNAAFCLCGADICGGWREAKDEWRRKRVINTMSLRRKKRALFLDVFMYVGIKCDEKYLFIG